VDRNKSFRFWFVVFVLQIFIACAVPTIVLLLVPGGETPVSLEIDGRSLHNLYPDEAKDLLNSFYLTLIEEGEVIFEQNGSWQKIPYKSFELQIDVEGIYDAAVKRRYDNRFFQLIDKRNNRTERLNPEVYFNKARLKSYITANMDLFREDTINAKLVLKDGVVDVCPHQNGSTINIDKMLGYIEEQLISDIKKQIVVSKKTCPDVFDILEPEITSGELHDITQIYTIVNGKITKDSTDNFGKLIEGINNRIIAPGETFSFRDTFGSSDMDSLHITLASAIYRSILPVEDIKVTWRQAAKQPISGIEAGFEVALDNDGDLRFINASDLEFVFVFNVREDGNWAVALAGKPGVASAEIKAEYTKISPPVFYAQDNTIPEKEQKTIDSGRDGLSVKVYRILNGKVIELYEDIYPPVNKVIAIGTGVKKDDIIRK